MRGAREEASLEGGLVVDSDGVDDARPLRLERSDALDGVQADECGGGMYSQTV